MGQKIIKIGERVEVHPNAVCGTVIGVNGSKRRVRFNALVAEWFPVRRLTVVPATPQDGEAP